MIRSISFPPLGEMSVQSCPRTQQIDLREPGLDISTHPLAQASVKGVGQAQIIDHLPVWQVGFLLPRNYLNCKKKHCGGMVASWLACSSPD